MVSWPSFECPIQVGFLFFLLVGGARITKTVFAKIFAEIPSRSSLIKMLVDTVTAGELSVVIGARKFRLCCFIATPARNDREANYAL